MKCLIKHGVDVHKRLSAGKNKETPLMMAAARGNMVIVKMLIKEKARVEEKGKIKSVFCHFISLGFQRFNHSITSNRGKS